MAHDRSCRCGDCVADAREMEAEMKERREAAEMDEATRGAHEKERTSVEAWTCENCGLVVGSLTRTAPEDKQGRCDKCHALFLAGVEHGRGEKHHLIEKLKAHLVGANKHRRKLLDDRKALRAKLARLLAADTRPEWPLDISHRLWERVKKCAKRKRIRPQTWMLRAVIVAVECQEREELADDRG